LFSRNVFAKKKSKQSRLSKLSPDKFNLKIKPTPPWIEAEAQWNKKFVRKTGIINNSRREFLNISNPSPSKLEHAIIRALKKKVGVIEATITDSKFTEKEFHAKGSWLSLRTVSGILLMQLSISDRDNLSLTT
jgi:hypothetical protein